MLANWNLNRDYRHKYEMFFRYGHLTHVWSVEIAAGAVHLYISDYGEKREKHFVDRYSGGVQYHWRYPPEHRPNAAPQHHDCPYTHGVCWHDGTSTYATEHYIPMIEHMPIDSVHEMVFRSLERDAERTLIGTPACRGC